MPLFHLRVPVINSFGAAASKNDVASVAIVAVQPIIPLGTNHPNDRVIGTTGRGNPWRALAASGSRSRRRRSLADLSQ